MINFRVSVLVLFILIEAYNNLAQAHPCIAMYYTIYL